MKQLFCANCGTKLTITRKAMPKYATIIDLVEYHICLEKPIEPNLTAVDTTAFVRVDGKDKFVQSLNKLNKPPMKMPEGPRTPGMTSTLELKDRRFEKDDVVKSTAPMGILDMVGSMEVSEPAHNLGPTESDD